MAADDVASIEIRSGVNPNGEPFNTVVVALEDKRMFLGQIPPETVRSMALDWLGAAEASETDAILFRLLQNEYGLSMEAAGSFITLVRGERG